MLVFILFLRSINKPGGKGFSSKSKDVSNGLQKTFPTSKNVRGKNRSDTFFERKIKHSQFCNAFGLTVLGRWLGRQSKTDPQTHVPISG